MAYLINEPEHIAEDLGECIFDGRYCRKYNVVFENIMSRTAYVAEDNGEVVYYDSNARSFLETAKGSGESEYGDKYTFDDASYEDDGEVEYVLMDLNRGIYAFDNHGYWGIFREVNKYENTEDAGLFKMLLALGEYAISKNMNYMIMGDSSNHFSNKVAVESYKSFQDAYDWYYDNFGLYSYDNNGAGITVITGYAEKLDNAYWSAADKRFCVMDRSRYLYTVACEPAVLCHEHTHISGMQRFIMLIISRVNLVRNIMMMYGKEVIVRSILFVCL